MKKGLSITARAALISVLTVLLPGSVPGAAAAGEVALDKAQAGRLLRSMSTLAPEALKGHPGITPEVFARILAFREEGRRFASVEEFKSVAGVTEEQFRRIAAPYRPRLSAGPGGDVGPAPPRNPAAKERRKKFSQRAGERKGGASDTGSGERNRPAGLGLDVKPHYYSVLPGYDLSILTDAQRGAFLEKINTERCACGDGTLGFCYVNDPDCPISKARVRKIYEEVAGKPPPPADEAREP